MKRKHFLLMALGLLVAGTMSVKGTPKEDVTITFAEWTAGMTLESRTPPGSFTKDGVTISIEQGAGYSAPYCSSGSYSYSNYFYVYSKNQISFSSNDIISGIDIELNYSSTTFTGTWSTGAMTVNKSTSSNKWVSWEGEGRDISVVVSSSFQITGFRLHFTEKPDVTVTFNDYDGRLIDSQTIPYLTDATPPADPSRDGWVFLGWDGGDWQNVKAATTLTAVYRPANKYTNLGDDRKNATVTGFDKDGISFVFAQGTGAQAPTYYSSYVTLYEGNTMTISSADNLLALDFGEYREYITTTTYMTEYLYIANYITFSSGQTFIGNDGHLYWIGDTNNLVLTMGSGPGLSAYDTYSSINFSRFGMPTLDVYTSGVNYNKFVNGIKLPASYAFYDAEGTGHMLPIVASMNNQLIRYNDYSQEFTSKETINYSPSDSYTDYVRYYEDINRNGRIDIQLCYDGRTGNSGGQNKTSTLLVAGTTSYTTIEKALALPGLDLNQDGRTDYLYFNGNQNFIRYLQSDGSYREEYMQLMTIDEYMATYDPDQWLSTEARVSNGLVQPERSIGTVTLLNGGALGGFGCTTCTPAQRVFASQAVDINADGMIDLVDKQNGLMYFNMGDGKWVYVNVGGQLTLADFTNNGYQDILIPGDATKLLLYNTASRTYTETTLFSDLPADPEIYAYDFDRDGDTDILVTFSSSDNTSGFAYTMFFQNNGNGQFTQIEEQDYGESMLLFNNLQDIDGDGYYDLLAFDLLHYSELGTEYYYWSGKTLWLKGQNNLTFAAPQELFEQDGSTGFFDSKESSSKRINADDLNNDGFADIWVSGVDRGTTSDKYTHIYGMNSVAVANTAPTAPSKPELIYENGILLVQWGNGSDAQTMTTDLTYALRIGTTSGGNDILNSHANADGKRRNYEDGNMGRAHSYTIDLRTYAPTTIYVSVQAVDAQHVGSAWSQEATIAHTSLPAMFTMSAASINLNDTLVLAFTPMVEGYTHTWLIEDGNLLPELTTASKESVLFTSGGTKHITHTLTAPNGQTASYTAVVQINPVGIKEVTTSDNISIATGILLNSPFDFNFDGLLDGVYNGSTVYKSDANFTFTAQSGMWNSNNSFGSYYMLHDWDHNGALDIVFGTGDNKYYLPHNGTSTFISKISDTNIEERLYNTGSNKRIYNFIDYNHNGNYDLLKADYNYAANPSLSECTMMIRGADGQYAEQAISGNVTNTQALYDICRKVYYYGSVGSYVDDAFVDMNHDGFTDLVTLPVNYVNNNPVSVSEVIVYLNKGNAHFDQLNIPLAADIAVAAKTSDIKGIKWMDMNADGYLDIVAYTNNGVPYILYNNANTSFREPQIMPLGELQNFYSNGTQTANIKYAVADIDYNGYPDIITLQEYTSSAEKYGVYVHFRSAEDVTAQGFLMSLTGAVSYPDNLQTVYSNNCTYLMVNRKLYEIVAATNERPAAPSGVRAVQTNDGLLIEWNAAVDDHTPTTLMQYNLSVKHAGQTGANAFVISPNNGLNANAAYLPGYDYISATQYLIPISALTVGDYEIQLQSIDGQKRMSEFSQPLTIHIDRQLIEAPTTVCVEKEATISYAGASQTGTPVWNFDGGTIVSGTGFGPYHVQWTTAGMKTISLTLNEETAQRMILVDELNPDEDFVMPEYLFANSSTKVNIPANMRTAWYLHMGGMRYSVTEGGIGGFDKRMVIKDNIITLNPAKSAANELSNFILALELELTNANGCTETYQQNLTILTADDIPQISLVTPDAQAHNVITWDADLSAIFPQVRVLKETNIYGQFVELTTLATTTATYTDLSSNSEQRAERYAIVGIMNGGIEAPISTVHQTVHMTINRGVSDGTYNLIWNNYQGAEVATYNILRGSSETTLTQIASVSSANISYTDNSPLDAQPVYAIEYVLSGAQASNSPAKAPARANTGALTGQSNVVNRSASRSLVYATSMAIYSANGTYATTADKPMLLLYAEIMPSTATYKSAQWSIVSGSGLATIDSNTGILTAKNPNTGGTVTVKATATDGSGVTATRVITIAAIQDEVMPEPEVYYTIRFLNYDGAVLQSTQVLEGDMPVYTGATPTKPEDAQYTYEFRGWSPAIVAATSDADYTAQYTATPKSQPVDYTPTGVVASQEGYVVWLDWNAVEGVSLYEWEFLNNGRSIDGDITSELYGGLNFEGTPAGEYPLVCRVRSLNNNQQPLSDWASVNFMFVVSDSIVTPPDSVDYTPKGLRVSQDVFIVMLEWNAVESVSYYEWDFLYNGNSIGGNTTSNLTGGLDFEGSPAGSYPLVCRVRSLDNNRQPISDWASVNFTVIIEKTEGLEDVQGNDVQCTKMLIDGILYIIRPDGKIFNAMGIEIK